MNHLIHTCKVCGIPLRCVQAKDARINNELEAKGYKVLRFWEFDINNHADKVQDTIRTVCGVTT